MKKYSMVVMFTVFLTACQNADEQYYWNNPMALKKALSQCAQKSAKGLNCQKLQAIAQEMETLAYELRVSPQNFGKKIIALQESVAKEESATENKSASELLKNKKQLQQYLYIAKWLESPGSRYENISQ